MNKANAGTEKKMLFPSFASTFVGLCSLLHQANAHGYLSSPRSRNLVASQDKVWWPITASDPEPETGPHSLNRGGSRARCGIVRDASGVERNYDTPKNAMGGPMPPNVQAEYIQGEEVVMDVTLTAHHKGHFVFSACPISEGEIPMQECFDQYPLTFVEDLLHGANYDANFPERAYIAPLNNPNYIPDYGSSQGIIEYSFKMRLPPDLYGDLVLIQWYYLTANSCYHEGYQQYNWPDGWKADAVSSMPCEAVSSDGSGSPEQFWNCAEVKINQASNPISAPSMPVNPPPTPANMGIAIPVGLPSTTQSNSPPSLFDQSSGISIPISLPSSSTQSSNSPPSSAGSHGKTIVGYYASWQWYDRAKKAAPENMDFSKVQRVNYAFFQVDTAGNMWGTDSWGDPNLLFGPYNWNPSPGGKLYCSWDGPTEKNCKSHFYEQGLIHLVHAAGAEIYPSLGGWTLSDAFPAMAANASARAKFVQNCVDLIEEYNFDGIDLDWEYPGYEDHSGTPQDRSNFKLLLNDIRAKLDELGAQNGKFYGLTAALPCGPRHIANMDIAHVASTLSELNLMTYDFHGAFSETTGINAPLYDQGWGEEDFDVHSCVENWLKGGGSRDKINIGLPFYGRSYAMATGMNQPHGGADQVWSIDEGTPQYFNIVAKLPSMTQTWDKKTWTQYAYFENGGLVSFDNENAICAKVQYAIENDLGGFIIWELSGDMMDDFSTPLLDVTNDKLHNPGLNCGEPGLYPEEEEDLSTPISTPTSPTLFTPTVPVAQLPMIPPTPVTFPSPAQPSMASPTSPVLANPSELPATPGTFPTPVSFQSTPKPTAIIAGLPNTQSSNPPDQTVLLSCGNQGGSFNLADSEPLELSFSYELHSYRDVLAADAVDEVQSSLFIGLADQLKCTGVSRTLRMLRTNLLDSSQDVVKAIEFTPPDLPENNSPCYIPIKFNKRTVCQQVTGSITTYVERDISSNALRDVADELLFYIRTSMAAGRYDSAKVDKVIYLESLSELPLESNVAANNNIVEPESEGGTNSSIMGIVFALLVLVLIGIALLVYVTRKRRSSEIRHVEEHALTESKPGDDVSITLPPTSSTEEVWKKALDTEETWRAALNTHVYGEEATNIGRDANIMESSVVQMDRELGNSGDKGIDELPVKMVQDKSTNHTDLDEAGVGNTSEERSDMDQNQPPAMQEENLPLDPPEGSSLHSTEYIQQSEQADIAGNKENIENTDRTMEPVDDHKDKSNEEEQTNSDDGGDDYIGNVRYLAKWDSDQENSIIDPETSGRKLSPTGNEEAANRVEELD